MTKTERVLTPRIKGAPRLRLVLSKADWKRVDAARERTRGRWQATVTDQQTQQRWRVRGAACAAACHCDCIAVAVGPRNRNRKRKHLGDCYRQAAYYCFDHPKATLVHGTIESMHGWPIAHAWAEEDGMVWDGSMAEWFDEQDFYERFRATPEVSYSQQQMREMMCQHKHYGSWHETAGSYRDRDGSLVMPKAMRDEFEKLWTLQRALEAGAGAGAGATNG